MTNSKFPNVKIEKKGFFVLSLGFCHWSFAAARRRGLTIIELVVTITVMGALAVGFSAYLKQAMDIWKFLSYRGEVVSQARLGALRMASDIRQIANSSPQWYADDTTLNFTHVDPAIGNLSYSYSNVTGNLSWSNDTIHNASLMTGLSLTLTPPFKFTYLPYNASNVSNPFWPPLPTPVSAENMSQIAIININATLQWGDQKANINLDVRPRNL